MLFDSGAAKLFAEKLLSIDAIKLRPTEPFTWASGWRSPIYCDNRVTLSYPDIRTWLKNTLAEGIRQQFPDVEIVAGVATAGIAHGALAADALGLPFAYVRSEAKKHGMHNKIEGRMQEGQKVVVVEDLISTGGSSLTVVEAVRNAGGIVLGMAALFTYAFDVAEKAMQDAQCPFFTISDYPTLIQYALESKKVDADALGALQTWREDPAKWMQD